MGHGWECYTSLCMFDPYRMTELSIWLLREADIILESDEKQPGILTFLFNISSSFKAS